LEIRRDFGGGTATCAAGQWFNGPTTVNNFSGAPDCLQAAIWEARGRQFQRK
jgi:hypothetical protein